MPKLDKRAVEGAQPKGRAYIIWDEDLPGFGLRVYASGRRTYLIQYKEGGRTRQFSMGSHEDLTPAAARRKAKELLADVAAADTEPAPSPARPAKPAAQKKAAAEAPASVALSRRPLARVSAASVGPAPSAKSPDTGRRAESEGFSEPPPPESGFRRIGAVFVLLGVLVIAGLWYASETTELVRTATTTDEPVPPEGGTGQPTETAAQNDTAAADTAATQQPAQAATGAAPETDKDVAVAAADEMAAAQEAAGSDAGTETAADGESEATPEMAASDGAAQPDDTPAPNGTPDPAVPVVEAPAADPPAVGGAPVAAAETGSGEGPRTIAAAEPAASLRPAAGSSAEAPAPAGSAVSRAETEAPTPDTEEIARLPAGDPGELAEPFDPEQAAEEARRRADRNPPPHECDRLAAAMGGATEAAGESADSADPSAAMRACEDAVNTYPSAARFKTQYAHAMQQAGNAEEAVKWHRRAADQGYGAAQYQLGESFATGSGVSQDYAEAYFWYTLALRRGNIAAGRSRDAIERELTRYEKESIGRRVRSWRPIP